MTDVNQDFSDPELESIINNAPVKTITANGRSDFVENMLIAVIALHVIATIAELVRFIQTRNALHFALFVFSHCGCYLCLGVELHCPLFIPVPRGLTHFLSY
jgi:hypothetical protein